MNDFRFSFTDTWTTITRKWSNSLSCLNSPNRLRCQTHSQSILCAGTGTWGSAFSPIRVYLQLQHNVQSLCPSSYCCDLHLRDCGQKVSNGALDLVCHVLQRLPLILLLWAEEECRILHSVQPSNYQVHGPPVCLLDVSVSACVF